MSDETFRLIGPLIPKGIVRPLLGVSPFFFLSDVGPKDVTFVFYRAPFYLPGVIFACAATFAEVFFFLIIFGFGRSKN